MILEKKSHDFEKIQDFGKNSQQTSVPSSGIFLQSMSQILKIWLSVSSGGNKVVSVF